MERTWQETKKIIDKHVEPLKTETITLEEALLRILAEDVIADNPLPPMATSAMDGYAINSSKTPGVFRISGEVYPGNTPDIACTPKEAVYVSTGAFLPRGADAVVRVEDAVVDGDKLTIKEKISPGSFVNPEGSEIEKGEVVLTNGTKIDYRILALLAHLGKYRIRVYQKPQVGIIVTGDEILEPYQENPTRPKNTNLYMLKGLLQKEGVDAHYIGKAEDRIEDLKRMIKTSVNSFHITITVGGVSKGKRDLVKKALKELHAEILVTQTNVKPGRPFAFALLDKKPIFCLPGYPSATLVNALEFLIPAVRKMQGIKEYQNSYAQFTAGEDFKSRKGKVYFIRVNLEWHDGRLYAYSAGNQLTSNYRTSAICQGLLIIPEDRDLIRKGEILQGLILKSE